ncbi:hypothetical protein OSB04_014615 [Centaurea solstitialis]|uniref:Uncharacterized protein n=1 Tax=Centaurea solstitialis TaxID=347529 RepID=A0AA38T9E1_9ASTR|nr:hypothetical protein OSB04_014615 [Centaurea solstitialis]
MHVHRAGPGAGLAGRRPRAAQAQGHQMGALLIIFAQGIKYLRIGPARTLSTRRIQPSNFTEKDIARRARKL